MPRKAIINSSMKNRGESFSGTCSIYGWKETEMQNLMEMAGILSGFDFTIEEYLADSRAVTARAEEFYSGSVHAPVGDAERDAVGRYVACRFEEKLQESVEWQPASGPIRSGNRIAFRFRDIVVSGLVRISPKCVGVTMISPYPGVSGNVQLWSFAPRIFTQEPFPDSPANEDGEARARTTLLNLYVTQAKAAARAKRMQDPV